MHRIRRLRYDLWIENVQKIAYKYDIDVETLIQILEGLEDVKTLFHSVEVEDFINFYLYEEKGEE